ncbi:MAG: leucine-rich repeat protein, partial [Lachnospiraceae bacterium]|nr:leucine-rich repeat protein [Lachnospiraceae bacterium]
VPATVKTIGYGVFKNCSSLVSAEIAGGEIKSYSNYYMFADCTALTDVTFGADVVEIPSNVCYGCTQLENVTINGGSIQSSAFSGRSSIKNLTLGDGVTSIGSYAFSGCTGLTSVLIPGGEIGSYAFSGCKNLAEVTIGKDVTDIKGYAFQNCPFTEIDVPAGVKTISANAFAGSALTSAKIAAETIGNGAFRELQTLTQVTLGDGVKEIGSNAFYNCDGITSITIPDTVQIIGASAFGGNDSLGSVDFGKGITEIGDNAFYDCDALKKIELPDTVQSIGEGAFAQCDYLHTADIPSGIVGKEAFRNCVRLMTLSLGDKVTEIGERAFYGCESLPRISGMAGVTEIGVEAFSDCGSLTQVTLPMGIDVIHEGAFRYTGLQSVTIPASVVSIEKNAFYDSKLKEINFTEGGGLQTIGESAFEGCRQLQSLSLPGSLETVGDRAFAYCVALESVAVGSGVIGENAFYGCSNLTEVLFSDKVTEIGSYAFGSCTKLESLLIPDSVGTIGSNAFDSCSGMKEITLPDGIDSIAPGTFSGCTSLQSIAIPDSVKEIGDRAFNYCYSLKDIQMADGVQRIGSEAFSGCSALQSVSIPDSVTVLGDRAFASCRGMTGIYLSNNLTDMGEYTFEGCTALERVNIPESLSHIGQYSFSGCESLKKILIPGSIKTIGIGAFRNCDSLTDIFFTGTREEWEALIASGNDNLKNATLYPGSLPTMAYFDPQGGSEVPAQAVTVNDVLIKPNDPVREHYIFGGWFRETTCENAWNFETDRVEKEITLYAKWIPSYTVTFASNGGSVVESVTLPAGTVLEAPEAPVYATYTFEGWFKDEECTQAWEFGDAVTADMTLYAKWAEVRFTVVFRTGEGSEVESQEIHEGEPVPRPEDPSREGYTFRGWYMAELSEPLEGYLWDFDTAITGYTEIYAFWEINKYTVSFDCGGGSEAEPVVVEFGQTVPQPDVTREGYALEGWYTDAAYTIPWDFLNGVVKSDMTLYVKWDKIYADIDVELSVSGGDEQVERFKLAGVLVSGQRIVVQNETIQRMKAGTDNQQKILNDLRGTDGVINVDYIVKPKGSDVDRIVRYAVADTVQAAKEKTFAEAVPYTDGAIYSVPVLNNNDEIIIGMKTQYYHWFDEDGESVGLTRNDQGIDISVEADNEFSVFGQTGYVLLPPEGVDYMRYGVRITAADTLEIKSEQLLAALAAGESDKAFLSGLTADSSKDGTTAYINVGVPVPEGSDELYSCGPDSYQFKDECSLITYYSDSRKYFVRSIPVAVKGNGSAETSWIFGNVKDKDEVCPAMRLRYQTQGSEEFVYQNLGAMYLYNNPVPMRTTDNFAGTGKKKTSISWDLERNTLKPEKKQYFMNDTTSLYLTSQAFIQDTNGQVYDELPEKYKDYTVEWTAETKSGNEIAVFVFDEADTTHQKARLDITPVQKGNETLTVTAVFKHPRLIDTMTCTIKTTVKAQRHAESMSPKDKSKQLILGRNGNVSYTPAVTLAPSGIYEKANAVVWSCDNSNVEVNGKKITFTEEGDYTLQGTLVIQHLAADGAVNAEGNNTSLTVEIPVTVFGPENSAKKLSFTASHKFPYKYTWKEIEEVYNDEGDFVRNKTVTYSEYRNYKTIKLDTGERSEDFDESAVIFVYAGGQSEDPRLKLSVDGAYDFGTEENPKPAPALTISVTDGSSAFSEKVTVWYKGRSKVLTVSYDPYTNATVNARLMLDDGEKASKLSPDGTYSYEFYDQKIVAKNKKHWKRFVDKDEETGEIYDIWWGYEEDYEPEDERVSVPSGNLKITLNKKLLDAQAAGKFTLNAEESSFRLNGSVSGGKITFQILGTNRKASISFSTASMLPDDFTLNVLTEPYMNDGSYWDEDFDQNEDPDWGDEEGNSDYVNGYYLVGDTVSLEALTDPGAADQNFTWSVNDKKLASVAAVKGDKSHATLTLKKAGTVTVTAQCSVWEESEKEDKYGDIITVSKKVTRKESITIKVRSNQRSFMEAGQAVSQAEIDLQDVFIGTKLRLEGVEGNTGFDTFGRSARVVSLVKGKYQDVPGYRCEWERQYVYLQANRRGKIGNLYIALDGCIEGKPATLYVPIKISFR